MSWFYYTGRAIIRCLFLLVRWQVTGSENVPRNGALIVVANHLSNADPPLVAVSIKRRAMIMAKEELFRNPVTGYFLRRCGAFPVYRSRFDRKALRAALDMLHNGMALVIFPEGTRSRDGKLQPGLAGAALLASLSGAPVLPVGIAGTDKLKSPIQLARRPRITVTIGKPFHLPPSDRVTRESLAAGTDHIMRRIADVLPAGYRGKYA